MGTAVKRGDGASPEVFTSIVGVKSVSIPGLSADIADVTTLASTSNYEEAISTVLRTGEISLALYWDPDETTQTAFLTDFASGNAKNYQIVFTDPSPTTYQFSCIVSGVNVGVEMTAEVTAEVTLKVTGVPNFSA